jgi:predicted ATP-dependent serine protease
MRGQRLGIEHPNLLILAETSLEQILKAAQEIQPAAMVVDSIQTVYTEQITSAPGSISQVQEVAGQLMWYAKRSSVPVFIIGHVTKEGAIAGPRLLEHIVDTVLYFEGDKGHSFRILRAVKNRFGSTNEIGVFEMKDSGLEEVSNPSELFLANDLSARRDRWWSPASKDRGRFWSNCKRWCHLRVTRCQNGWRTAWSRIEFHCCWRSWKNGWVCIYPDRMST